MATITLSVPLKDWGKRKNAYLAARSTVEAAERSEQETARDTELDVALTVADFNERQAIVETARQNQIASLQNYWLAYYHLRRLTLYDYQRHQIVRPSL